MNRVKIALGDCHPWKTFLGGVEERHELIHFWNSVPKEMEYSSIKQIKIKSVRMPSPMALLNTWESKGENYTGVNGLVQHIWLSRSQIPLPTPPFLALPLARDTHLSPDKIVSIPSSLQAAVFHLYTKAPEPVEMPCLLILVPIYFKGM